MQKAVVGDIISSVFVYTVSLCAGDRSNGNKHLISSPENLAEEEGRGVDSKVQLLKGCSFYLDQWSIAKGPRCQGWCWPDTFSAMIYVGSLPVNPKKHTNKKKKKKVCLLNKYCCRSCIQTHHFN